MGIRDYLRDWVDPYDAQTGLKPGDTVVAPDEAIYSTFTVPKGALLVVNTVPESRHGADPYGLSSVNWTDPETGQVHEGLEWALSDETAEHHFGEKGVTLPRGT